MTIKITYHEPKRIYPKSPDEIQTYQVDYTQKLKGNTISASAWTVSGNITKDSDTNTTTTSTITVSSGIGEVCLINLITDSSGEKFAKALILNVEEKEDMRLCL